MSEDAVETTTLGAEEPETESFRVGLSFLIDTLPWLVDLRQERRSTQDYSVLKIFFAAARVTRLKVDLVIVILLVN